MTFDFFAATELPVPEISVSDAERIAADQFGIDAVAEPLGSQQDANFLLRDTAGESVGVLKIANPAFSLTELEAQHAAAGHIARRWATLRTAVNVELAGRPQIVEIPSADGVLYARIISFLAGGTMTGTDYLAPSRVAGLGAIAGRCVAALADFDHPGVDRILQWDLQHADRTVALLAEYVSDEYQRTVIRDASAAAWRIVSVLAPELRKQVIHCDITDDNVVCDTNGIPDGLIDFGDLTHSWAVGELAVGLAAVLRHEGCEPAATLPAVLAFHHEWPLNDAEIAALWPLVVLRAATLVVSGIQQVAIDAENSYVADALEHEWLIFQRSTAVPAEVMTELFRAALVAESPTDRSDVKGASLLAPWDPASVETVDLTAQSDALDAGVWIDPQCENELAQRLLNGGAAAVVTEFGRPRLTRSALRRHDSPATVPTGIDVWLATRHSVASPWDGMIAERSEHVLTIETTAGMLRLQGDSLNTAPHLRELDAVSSGIELASVGPGRLRLQWATRADVPDFVRPEYAPGWMAFVRDPSELIGLEVEAVPIADSEEVLQRRGGSFAEVQEMYYSAPPRIERGWREHLIDVDGRSYLDMVNNVAAVGHGHLVLADAVAKQWRLLNTNSRFNYASVAAFAERLAATLPQPLDTVFLVNSGSEAVDLALRLAFAATGHSTVVSVLEAYHGWTYATDAISTSVADNPNALTTRPDWVRTVPSPNSFRGDHRGVAAARYGPEAAEYIKQLAGQGNPPAAFICEPFYGNAGGVELPAGYLREVYQAVRDAGGVAIADEVQVGYGRLGRWFWGFLQQDVVPDIVTVAKAMGNGQPLGAVITTRAIADAYRSQGYFFSSAGGSPVSCVVGMTVLDLIEQEGLQDNALQVGDHLRRRLTALAEKHSLIGAVHGSGLYMGVELVRDRATLEPAVTETAAICERMRELGVIVQPTGDHNCVLKMKPPMCITTASADFFVDTLDQVLTTGW